MFISLTLPVYQKKWKYIDDKCIAADDENLTKCWRESEKTFVEWFWQSLAWVRIADPHQILKPAADRLFKESLFTYCEVDIFGSFLVKDGWEIHNRYGMMVTCLSSMAVHIETTSNLTTDSFIQAVRWLISRIGNVWIIQSDSGTNFFWCKVSWKRNLPMTSNMGGVWEWQIWSAGSILSAMLRNHGESLNDKSLHTLLMEAEGIIDSWPINGDYIGDVNSIIPLRPIPDSVMLSNRYLS